MRNVSGLLRRRHFRRTCLEGAAFPPRDLTTAFSLAAGSALSKRTGPESPAPLLPPDLRLLTRVVLLSQPISDP